MPQGGGRIIVFDGVYPPSEDSYLLLDSLVLTEEDRVLDVGCGSGIISIEALENASSVVSLDISLEAARNTRENILRNGLESGGNVVQADLLTALSPAARFTVLVFNPPYLPRDENSTTMDQALVGGEKGHEVILRFLDQIAGHIEGRGRVYVVMSSLSDPDTVSKHMESLGMVVKVLAVKPQFFEKLVVLMGTLRHKETVL